MDFISTLWMPILLSAVFVFIASSVIHMMLGYHASDYDKLPDEDGTMDAIRNLNIPPGQYLMPKAGSMKEFKSEAFQAKLNKGPAAFLNIRQHEAGMGKNLTQWFLYCLVISFFTAYVVSHTVAQDAHYLVVFRVVGAVAFMAYGLGHVTESIWMGRSWSATGKSVFDGLVYALLTAGTFGWLWA